MSAELNWDDDDFVLNLVPTNTPPPVHTAPQPDVDWGTSTSLGDVPPPFGVEGPPTATAEELTPKMRARTEAPSPIEGLGWGDGTISLKKLKLTGQRMKDLLQQKSYRENCVAYVPVNRQGLFPHFIVEFTDVGVLHKVHLTPVSGGNGRGTNGRIWYHAPRTALFADPTCTNGRGAGLGDDFQLTREFLSRAFGITIQKRDCFYKRHDADRQHRYF
jgi:hypothetical protein